MHKNKLLKKKSPLFVIAIAITFILFILFGIWIAGRIIIRPDLTYETTSKVEVVNQPGDVKYEEIDGLKYIWKENNGQLVDQFKVMSTGDLHISDKFDMTLTLKVLDKLIDREKPDLLVLVGDTLDVFKNPDNYDVANKFINLFEDKKQYWTFVLGNHDGDTWQDSLGFWQSRQHAFEVLTGSQLASKPQYCLATSEGNDISKFGLGTNCINIGKPGNIMQSLYFFDCMSIHNKVNQDVINWYVSKIQAVKTANNNILPESIAFNHIAFAEMQFAYQNIGKDDNVTYHYGMVNEKIGSDELLPNGLFDQFKLGNTKTIIFSHEHVNNLCISYDGIKMAYSLGLISDQYSTRARGSLVFFNSFCYCLDNYLVNYIDGATDYVIQKNKPTQLFSIYNQFNNIYDGIKNDLYKKCLGLITYNAQPICIMMRILAPLAAVGCIVYFVFFIKQTYKNKSKSKK